MRPACSCGVRACFAPNAKEELRHDAIAAAGRRIRSPAVRLVHRIGPSAAGQAADRAVPHRRADAAAGKLKTFEGETLILRGDLMRLCV
jgi:hypothetical protein